MLAIICLYFIGKAFSELAHEYNKNRWLFAILGIAVFYIGQFLFGILLGALSVVASYDISKIDDLVLGIICLPVGGLICWAFYRILKKRWGNESMDEKAVNEEQIIDGNLME